MEQEQKNNNAVAENRIILCVATLIIMGLLWAMGNLKDMS